MLWKKRKNKNMCKTGKFESKKYHKKRSSETDDLNYITYSKNINYFTLLQIAANASGLFIARSARTLRLMSTFAA